MSILREIDSAELDAEIEKLFRAKGASHNFQLGVLALAHTLATDDLIKRQLLLGMMHIQAMVVTHANNEVGHVSHGLKEVLGLSTEEIKEVGLELNEMLKAAKGSESQE